ncbi:MAG: glutamate-5-semialdehyde dehydrogenase [Puniceicoccales bacterium]|jgi:glutamate-5-semialdehyde dehydrogenase|nr:glutamate-5-semialdehyde dehydrogenase [Puniceicoccales bacterium]
MTDTDGTDAALRTELTALATRARDAARRLATASTTQKNAALLAVADALRRDTDVLLAANQRDLAASTAAGLSAAMTDRLRLTPERIGAVADGVASVAALPDPVGATLREWTRPNGLRILKRSVPIGVIGIIYESRPNVTADAAALCLKAGNATLLRGGSEAFHSNTAIAASMDAALTAHGFAGAVALVPTTAREAIPVLCSLENYIDLLIPRGGHGLISTVVQHARMPVIKHYNGICHVFVHRDADLDMAEKIILNAKCQRPSACNAMETLLVDKAVAPAFLPRIAAALRAANVEIRADADARQIVSDLKPATDADWDTEHLDFILNVRLVDGTDAAIAHITAHGSQHSDAIVTANATDAEHFLNAVDSATVYWNASTRFTDGGEFGFGAEIGISTGKLHARGPMGLEELTSYKYQIIGTGQARQ